MSNTSVTDTNPSWLDKGDNAWQLTAASLVGLQSIPGLMVLYAGIMPRKWAINSAFMAFYGFSATLICWVVWVYRMGFGEQWIPLAGVPGPVLGIDGLLEQATLPAAGIVPNFPLATMVYFQFVFAAITIVIIAGSYLGRMNFLAWMVFVPLWLTLCYSVGAFSIWAGGFLFQLGVIDYSGGYVIHLSAGTAGFVGAYIIGPRPGHERLDKRPNNTLMVLTGAGILWMGWNGFNGGDPYAASPDAGVAVLNTNICTAMSLLTWTLLDVLFYKKPSIVGAVQGMITGLVAITPAAGVVAGWGAIAMGALSGSIPWISMNILGKTKIMSAVDDSLGVFHTHLVAGFLGGFMTGIFATIDGSAAFALTNPGGAIAGNGRQVWVQLVGALFVIGWDSVWTAIILYGIKYILRIPLRMSEAELAEGIMLFMGGCLSLLHRDSNHDEASEEDKRPHDHP
ncbi:putative ammonium transporter [Gymnopilus junonius]|uniref:Ammonium transporter n=1 Tax=Gymnopilus junonius TaxID=109634 RepID=A0A9P5TJ97_GYMJU|nr:putative ammonium transporter [Gymnopilus junonius]